MGSLRLSNLSLIYPYPNSSLLSSVTQTPLSFLIIFSVITPHILVPRKIVTFWLQPFFVIFRPIQHYILFAFENRPTVNKGKHNACLCSKEKSERKRKKLIRTVKETDKQNPRQYNCWAVVTADHSELKRIGISLFSLLTVDLASSAEMRDIFLLFLATLPSFIQGIIETSTADCALWRTNDFYQH